jgi:hypothetical protein
MLIRLLLVYMLAATGVLGAGQIASTRDQPEIREAVEEQVSEPEAVPVSTAPTGDDRRYEGWDALELEEFVPEPEIVAEEPLRLQAVTTEAPASFVPYRGEDQVCEMWHDLALAVGWPAEEVPMLSYVMWRESRCDPGAINRDDPMSGSRGIIQINGFWCRPNQYTEKGWLQDQGILNTCEDLFDPETNLRAGLAIWLYGVDKHRCGWGPWAMRCSR